jgi:hypothetical protein
MACTAYCVMQTTLNDRTVGILLHLYLFKRFKSVFAVTGDLQMSVILHLLKVCDHQTAVYVTALKMSHFKPIFSHSVKLFCKQYILCSVLVLKLGSVINTLIPKTDLNNIKNRVYPSQRTHFVSN